jgi:hypothetical protein
MFIARVVVLHDHSWSKHRDSKPWISAAPKTGEIQYCKMFADSFLHFTF